MQTQQTLLALQGSALDPTMRSQHRGGPISLADAPPPWIVQYSTVLVIVNPRPCRYAGLTVVTCPNLGLANPLGLCSIVTVECESESELCAMQQQEQDPTNLYFANLPAQMTENDLENMLLAYGPVTSTRILRDQYNLSRGVGFARMESKEKCEVIIKAFSGKSIAGSFL